MPLYDAHNHAHDDRLRPWRDTLLHQALEVGIVRMVVNGSCEADWPQVLSLARQDALVLPSVGVHPWYVRECTEGWKQRLVTCLDDTPQAVLGEVGLDRWILESQKRSRHITPGLPQAPASLEEQAEVFVWQLRLAAERTLPLSIHCLQAWGLLFDLLRREPRPACGFLLHSYGGPAEMVKPLADLGAYFSLPGFFAHPRKHRQRETFRQVPPDRLLIETDAPDQCLPADRDRYQLSDLQTGARINHPANLAAVYEFAAELLGEPIDVLAQRVEGNFRRLFAGRC
jgi:TatD DNase family protein